MPRGSSLIRPNGSRLTELCYQRGLTKVDLIVGTRVSERSISRILKDPSYKLATGLKLRIANFLEVHPNEIFT